MNKSLIIFGAILTSMSLTAFGIIKWDTHEAISFEVSNDCHITIEKFPLVETKEDFYPDFFYGVGTRFSGIKKTTINNAVSIKDIFDEEEFQKIESIKSVTIIVIENDEQTDIRETGYSELLTPEQKNLLKTSDYSTNFLIRADYKMNDKVTGDLFDYHSTPYLTIVPEKQAAYKGGEDALLEYFEKNNKKNTANLTTDNLRPAKLYFTVTKKGKISKIKLDRSSGSEALDESMIKLLKKAPGKWNAAENINGEKTDQELVISFGIRGC